MTSLSLDLHRRLNRIPGLVPLLVKPLRIYRAWVGPRKLRKELESNPRRRIVIGASGVYEEGWIPTGIDSLNILDPADWERFFKVGSIDAMLAEHVWEHLTLAEGQKAARNCYRYLRPGGYLRVAVPDGFHPSARYIEAVRVGGNGLGADDHKVLYNYETLSQIFEKEGFRVTLLEYFDESNEFHYAEWSPADGKIWRSSRFDERNQNGMLNYTSLVLDAVKEGGSETSNLAA